MIFFSIFKGKSKPEIGDIFVGKGKEGETEREGGNIRDSDNSFTMATAIPQKRSINMNLKFRMGW